jgi:hypothetical protein
MTQKEAKELTLELWRYLAEHPGGETKGEVTGELQAKIQGLRNLCPLCEVFGPPPCVGCPLVRNGAHCEDWDSPWDIWRRSGFDDSDVRRRAAERLVEIVSAWEPEDEA